MAEFLLADFSGGLNLSAAADKLPVREALLADACSFDRAGDVVSTGATTKQNTSAYTDGANTNVHSLWVNPTIRHVAGVGNDSFSGTGLGSLALLNDEANSAEAKMSFADWVDSVFYETNSTARWINSAGTSATVDWPAPATAAANGPNSPGTLANVGAGSKTHSWTNPANAAASDNAYATAGTGSNRILTEYLRATNFGFAIAGTPNVLGFLVEVELSFSITSGPNSSGTAYINATMLKAGVPVGDTRTTYLAYLGNLPTTDAYISIGSASDLFGETWTVANINAATWGVQVDIVWLGFDSPATVATARIDHIRITPYTESGGVAVATGAAGNPNGTFTYKATFVDGNGKESEPSNASASVAPASQIVDVSSIPVGDARTTKRFIYRKGGTLTFYYWVGEVSDNATTTFADNSSDATVLATGLLLAGEAEGDPFNTRLGASATVKYPAIYYDRVFWVDQTSGQRNRILWSKVNHPWAYPSENFIDVGDDKPIVRLIPFLDDLIIFKTDSIWRLTGKDETSFVLFPTPATVGTTMPFTIVKLQDRILFTNTQGIWFFDGLTARKATNRLERFFLAETVNGIAPFVTTTAVQEEFDATFSENIYYLAYADTGSANNRILVMDLEGGTISRRSVTALSLATDPTTGDVYFGDASGFVKKLDDVTSADDSGSAVTWTFQTKFVDPQRGENKSFTGVEFYINTGGQSLTPTIYYDGGNANSALATISSSSLSKVFKSLPASSTSRKAQNISVRLSGSLTTVNSSNAPAVVLSQIKVYYEPLKERARTA